MGFILDVTRVGALENLYLFREISSPQEFSWVKGREFHVVGHTALLESKDLLVYGVMDYWWVKLEKTAHLIRNFLGFSPSNITTIGHLHLFPSTV